MSRLPRLHTHTSPQDSQVVPGEWGVCEHTTVCGVADLRKWSLAIALAVFGLAWGAVAQVSGATVEPD